MDVSGTLAAGEISVQDDFIAPSRLRDLADCLRIRRQRGDFNAARIGGEHTARRPQIRGDFTCWLAEPLFAAERALLDDLEQLRLRLNQRNFMGLLDTELHYAWYPPGAEYARHVDQPFGREQRKVSLVLYLNEYWPPAAGGELRIFDRPDRYRDIIPLGGRLVCFLTSGREHAVLPAQADRLSISGWFRARD